MLKYLPLILALALTFTAMPSPAGVEAPTSAVTVDGFKAVARSIPDTLRGLGFTRFGKFDLQKMTTAIDGINITIVPRVIHPQTLSNGTVMDRNSAQWRPGAIDVSEKLWPETPEGVRPVLALHECLGALALVDDDNYVVSSAMWLLTLPQAHKVLRPDEIKGLSDRIRAQVFAGGITGVGGGGDVFGLTVKMVMLSQSLSRVSTALVRADAIRDLYGVLYVGIETKRGQQ